MTAHTRSLIRHAAALIAITVLAMAGAGTAINHAAAQAAPVKITVKTTDNGFEPGTVEVEQGKLVELTFVWSHTAHPNEEHIVVLEGYRLESDKLDKNNREVTLKFVADKAGKFTFKCDIECDTHDVLQKGELIVKAGTGGSAERTAAKLVVNPSDIVVKSGGVTVNAALQDPQGKGIAKAELVLTVEHQFVGTKSQVEVAVAKTGADGTAKLSYRPTVSEKQAMTVSFEGMGIYAGSELKVEAPSSALFQPAAEEVHSKFEDFKGGAPLVLVIVMVAIWGTFAFIIVQAVRLRGAR